LKGKTIVEENVDVATGSSTMENRPTARIPKCSTGKIHIVKMERFLKAIHAFFYYSKPRGGLRGRGF